MPAIMSVAFSSLSGRFKKSAKDRQAVNLKTRRMSATQLDMKEQNDPTVVDDQNVDENLKIKLKFDDRKWSMYNKEYRVPLDLSVNGASVNDELQSLEEQVKILRHNAKIYNQTMHSMQAAIKHLQVELTSMKTTIKDQGNKI